MTAVRFKSTLYFVNRAKSNHISEVMNSKKHVFSNICGHWKHHLTFELASYFPIVGSYHSVNVVLHINVDLQSNIVLLILKKPLTRFPFMDSFQKVHPTMLC